MILGLSLAAFTLLHAVISLVALVTGGFVLVLMLKGQNHNVLTPVFLATTALTSGTGFLFPAHQVLPSHIVGIVSLAVVVIAWTGYYGFRLTRAWRWVYVVAAVTALYLNAFVTVVQSFLKIEPLHALASTGSEPAFIVVQTAVLAAFISAGVFAVRRFYPVISPIAQHAGP
jgi:hypothetical protein